MGNCKITFQPGGQEVTVPEGTDLLSAAISAGIQLYNSCGGEGVCGECKVIVRQGKVVSEPTERLTQQEREAGYCLACRTVAEGAVVVEVPPESRIDWEQILTESGRRGRSDLFGAAEEVEKGVELDREAPFTPSPLTARLFLDLSPPTTEDSISDLERVYRGIRQIRKPSRIQTGLACVRSLGRLLRESRWQVTVTLAQQGETAEVIQIEPGDTSQRHYGIALDIGTTTVVASLVDLNTGRPLGMKAAQNKQASYGQDVITRIIYAEKDKGLVKLHHAVTDTVNELILALVTEHQINLNDVTTATCAGNMTMTHLLLQVDPYYIRRDPYVPTASFIPAVRASEVGIRINPRGLLTCLPGVSSYVGGDITAGVLASGIDDLDNPTMLIDLGTNGEIALGNREWLVCSSASAGPAFEGSGVQCGVRAVRGAIQRLEISDGYDVTCKTIGDARPIGICGSGYIDILAELLKVGVVDRQGAIRSDAPTPRIRKGESGLEFVLVWAVESGTDWDIVITQADIENLIRTKGSIYSAAKVLVDKMGMAIEGIDRIFIGGGFGNYMNIEKSICIGLLPDLPVDRYEFVGNSSFAGARMTMLSQEAMHKAEKIAERMTNIDLCSEPSYMGEYVGSLFLPHTDINLFPTVKRQLGI